MVKTALKALGLSGVFYVMIAGFGLLLSNAPNLEVPEREDFSLSGMTVINPEINRLANHTVEVRGSQIERVYPSENEAGESGSKSSYTGMYVLPGLIEMHAHIWFQADHFNALFLLH